MRDDEELEKLFGGDLRPQEWLQVKKMKETSTYHKLKVPKELL